MVAFIDANAAILRADAESAERHWAAGLTGALKSGSISYAALCHVQLIKLAETAVSTRVQRASSSKRDLRLAIRCP